VPATRLAEWLYEAGIGEARAALLDRGMLVEMVLERDDDPYPRAGSVLDVRLVERADASGRALVRLPDGGDAWLLSPPPGISQGARLRVEVVREPLPEAGSFKPAHVRAAPDAALRDTPGLIARLAAGDLPARAANLDDHGWAEAMEEAASGIVARPEALLRIALTPAMTLIDVDGRSAAADLAVAGARLAGQVIRRFGITGSIGIDLPTLPDKASRQLAAAALDAVVPQPFERAAVNGFGFLHLVRRRARASVMERLAADPVGSAALALLRQGERTTGHGPLTLAAHPRVVARLAARAGWTETLSRRVGAPVVLSEQAALAISAGHAFRSQI
jgi:hypothetical protein